jgi:type II secretory pathway pseudopilin PulG
MRRRRFTFTEVLVAVVVVALIVPVALRGISVARQVAGDDVRYELAARLADEKLGELMVTGRWEDGDDEGVFEEEGDYQWSLTTESFEDDDDQVVLTVLELTVSCPAAVRPVSVTLTALAASEAAEED